MIALAHPFMIVGLILGITGMVIFMPIPWLRDKFGRLAAACFVGLWWEDYNSECR